MSAREGRNSKGGDSLEQVGSCRDRLAEVLAGTHRVYHGDAYGESEIEVGDTLARHLADVILRDWLPGALADERVVEAAIQAALDPHVVMAEAWIGDDGEPLDYLPQREALIGEMTRDATRAALTAAVTALREEAERG